MSDKYSFENYILRCEAGKIEDERDALTAKIETLTAENARLRALVEHVEWVYTGETTWVCPWCNGEKYAGGHAADCPRQAALGEGE